MVPELIFSSSNISIQQQLDSLLIVVAFDIVFDLCGRFSIAEHQERYREDCQRIFDVQNKVPVIISINVPVLWIRDLYVVRGSGSRKAKMEP